VIQVLVDAGPVRLGEDGTEAEELAVELGLGHLSVVKVFLPGFEECLGGEERVWACKVGVWKSGNLRAIR
jgi:hypothetical protein